MNLEEMKRLARSNFDKSWILDRILEVAQEIESEHAKISEVLNAGF